MQRFLIFLAYLLGLCEGLLLARLIIRLFAARPDHPVFTLVLQITAPLVSLLAGFDQGQPRFGAVLELSTLFLVVTVPIVGLILAWIVKRFR